MHRLVAKGRVKITGKGKLLREVGIAE